MPKAERIPVDRCMSYSERTRAIQAIAEQVRENAVEGSRIWWQLMLLVTYYGQELLEQLVSEAKDLESKGGMMTLNGSRRRTLGGVFFQLVRREIGPAASFELRVDVARYTDGPLYRRAMPVAVAKPQPERIQRSLVLKEPAAPNLQPERTQRSLVPKELPPKTNPQDVRPGQLTRRPRRHSWSASAPEIVIYRRAVLST